MPSGDIILGLLHCRCRDTIAAQSTPNGEVGHGQAVADDVGAKNEVVIKLSQRFLKDLKIGRGERGDAVNPFVNLR